MGEKIYDSFLLNTIDRIRMFVLLNSESQCEIDVTKGRYTVDGKSIMGIFSLEVSRPLQVKITGKVSDIERLDSLYKEKGLI